MMLFKTTKFRSTEHTETTPFSLQNSNSIFRLFQDSRSLVPKQITPSSIVISFRSKRRVDVESLVFHRGTRQRPAKRPDLELLAGLL